jgi:hypothetical protein
VDVSGGTHCVTVLNSMGAPLRLTSYCLFKPMIVLLGCVLTEFFSHNNVVSPLLRPYMPFQYCQANVREVCVVTTKIYVRAYKHSCEETLDCAAVVDHALRVRNMTQKGICMLLVWRTTCSCAVRCTCADLCM